jgi:hypothetical protein
MVVPTVVVNNMLGAGNADLALERLEKGLPNRSVGFQLGVQLLRLYPPSGLPRAMEYIRVVDEHYGFATRRHKGVPCAGIVADRHTTQPSSFPQQDAASDTSKPPA